MATITSDQSTKLIPKDSNVKSTTLLRHAHPIVGDRIIEGAGTSSDTWQNWTGLQKLPPLNIQTSFGSHQRVCIFAPHPDDEILGCGGLLQQLADNGNPIVLIHVTNGTQSHPNSKIYSPEQLNIIRPKESVEALKALSVNHQVTTLALNLTDGDVFAQQALFYQKLASILQPDDILVTTFTHDGHPDHEATGQVVTSFAKHHYLLCYQVLIWAWHWAKPDDSRIPWHHTVRVDLTPEQLEKKIQAIHCFKSQTTEDVSTGNSPILTKQTITRISQPWEVYIYEPYL